MWKNYHLKNQIFSKSMDLATRFLATQFLANWAEVPKHKCCFLFSICFLSSICHLCSHRHFNIFLELPLVYLIKSCTTYTSWKGHCFIWFLLKKCQYWRSCLLITYLLLKNISSPYVHFDHRVLDSPSLLRYKFDLNSVSLPSM